MLELRWRCLLAVGCLFLLAMPDVASAAVHGAALAADDSFWDGVWHAFLKKPHAFVIAVAFFFSLVAGDDQAWGWLLCIFLLVLVGTIVFFETHPTALDDVKPSKVTAGITTGVLAVAGILLYALHLKRPGFFATTEIAFALAGIYFSIRGIGGSSSAWVGLGVSMYGLVEGIDRLAKAIDAAIGPDETETAGGASPATPPKSKPRGRAQRAD
jgi:hypothetical protein